jgi:hypothetical protein
MRIIHKLQKDGHILGLTNIIFEKIGLIELAKPESKLEAIIMPRTS